LTLLSQAQRIEGEFKISSNGQLFFVLLLQTLGCRVKVVQLKGEEATAAAA